MYAEKIVTKMTNYSMNTIQLLPVIENQLPLNTSKRKLIPKVFKLTLLITVQ
jgi:hypothetical protein